MNANNNQTQQLSFQWHNASALRHANGECSTAISTPPVIVSGVHFIDDVNCESTLRGIQQALHDGVEFCVHSESSSNISANDQSQAHTSLQRPPHILNNAGHAYLQCMSSGSNGEPKRIRRTHLSWINSFHVTTKNANLSSTDSYAIVGKLSHSLALYAALEAAWIGADIHALSDLRADKQLAAIATLKSSVLYATPTQLRMLCRNSTQSVEKNMQLQHVFCGGGKLDELTRSLLVNYFPNAAVKEFYGASETSFITMSDAATPTGSVGKLYPGVQMQILSSNGNGKVNDEPINQQSTNSIGEIWVKSPYLFEQYGDGVEVDTRWDNGFLCIGELGYIDGNNNLFLTGRRSRMINIADNMVFPEQIENLINENKAVRHCAVIPVHDAKRGCVLIAVVETAGAIKAIGETEPVDAKQLSSQLLKQCREQLGALKAPRDVLFVDNLPMLASGKPDLQALSNEFDRP